MKKREKYLSWDEYFMGLALLSAQRSKDPNTQVGACIVSRNNIVQGLGYNGLPLGIDDDAISWSREDIKNSNTKYPYVIHAEQNAILNSNAANLRGSKIYITTFPCSECSKLIIQKGIEEIIYLENKHGDTDNFQAAQKLLKLANVKQRQLKTTIKITY